MTKISHQINKIFSAFLTSTRSLVGNKKGMSLIEIMIVLSIIGVIMGMILPRVMGQKDKANVKQARIFLSQISEAIQGYQNDCGKLPQSLDSLQKPDASCPNWGPDPYYRGKKMLDPWGNPPVYILNGGDYVLKSLGRDGKEGGSGYDKDISTEDE